MCPHPWDTDPAYVRGHVGILSRQFEGTESEKPNGHQSGNMGEKTEDRYISSPSSSPPPSFLPLSSPSLWL